MTGGEWWREWSPSTVTIADEYPDNAWKVCVISGVYFGDTEYNGKLGARISSIFVILVTSIVATIAPLLARRSKIPEVCYVVARMLGSGVIVATAFIHLMDPAYNAIGPNSCVAMTGAWASYSWCAAIIMCGSFLTFLVDIYCNAILSRGRTETSTNEKTAVSVADDENDVQSEKSDCRSETSSKVLDGGISIVPLTTVKGELEAGQNFKSQLSGFLILESGILLHSVMIGLSLGTTGNLEALYASIVFHQAFEGLGIGARLSSIPFPQRLQWFPYFLSMIYGITTPIAIAIGIGLRYTYREHSYTSMLVSGILDSLSAGVLLYTGFVELIARDFVFVEPKPRLRDLNIQIFSLLAGAGVMALIGKWA